MYIMTVQIRFLVSLAGMLLLLSGCSRSPSQPVWQPLNRSAEGAPPPARDPLEILDARIAGDDLIAQLRFTGGCAEHSFELLHSGIFRESLPVQTDLLLAHDAEGERCTLLVLQDVALDLSPLRKVYLEQYGRSGGTIMISLYPPEGGPAVHSPLQYDF